MRFSQWNTVKGLEKLQDQPNIVNNLVEIFNSANQPEIQEWVMKILEKSSKNYREQAINISRKRPLKYCSFGPA